MHVCVFVFVCVNVDLYLSIYQSLYLPKLVSWDTLYVRWTQYATVFCEHPLDRNGTPERLWMTGEEVDDGRAVAVVVTGPSAGM